MDTQPDKFEEPRIATRLDARGLLCPLPVLKLRKRLLPLSCGEVIEVTTDDPAAVLDVPYFCQQEGHSILSQDQTEQSCKFVIQKG